MARASRVATRTMNSLASTEERLLAIEQRLERIETVLSQLAESKPVTEQDLLKLLDSTEPPKRTRKAG